ncbi:MAG: non-hydrolyzing UDP-N-acetylglucosamine 2-epimerase [Candidatus Binatia bacterium]
MNVSPDSGTRTVLCVFGTRPEAIKMAPVIRALAACGDGLRPAVCVTDQHREMLDPVLRFFGIQPHHRLGVMREGQTPSAVAARILDGLPAVLAAVRPTAVLVQGDTTTTIAAALASFYAGIPVGHVEAGLRTYRKDAPFPEEINRQITTVLAEWHFAATDWARDNLVRAGVAKDKVAVTGNPIIDALVWTVRNLDGRQSTPPLRLDGARRMVLVTAHRRESFGKPFMELCAALRQLAERNPDVDLVYPVHLNPHVQAPVRHTLQNCPRIHLLPPLDYWHLVGLLRRCYLVLTDSGGIQEEAPALGKPVLVMRDTTERPEGVAAGTARLVGTSRDRIVAETEGLLRDPARYARMARAHNPYGDGHAATRIAQHLSRTLCGPGHGHRNRPAGSPPAPHAPKPSNGAAA